MDNTTLCRNLMQNWVHKVYPGIKNPTIKQCCYADRKLNTINHWVTSQDCSSPPGTLPGPRHGYILTLVSFTLKIEVFLVRIFVWLLRMYVPVSWMFNVYIWYILSILLCLSIAQYFLILKLNIYIYIYIYWYLITTAPYFYFPQRVLN